MPIVRVEDCTIRSPSEKQVLVEIIYSSLRDVLGVSNDELQARYQHIALGDAYTPGGRATYLQITITLFKGRTYATKCALYADIITGLQRGLAVDPESVLILLDEHNPENWGMSGGIPACDLDFGYQIDV